jgi:hypothetical protein
VRAMLRRRRRTKSLMWGRDGLFLDSSLGLATAAVACVFVHLNFAVHEERMITLLDIFVFIIVVFLVHIRIRGREGRVNVLRLCLVLGSLPSLETHNVCLLEGTIFVKRAADKVSAVREIWSLRTVDLECAASALDHAVRSGCSCVFAVR